uniref:WAP domain-containing protein n=1 Tax=Salarias fasciatus TaxID=181472 RepID=A0A672FWT5_SALFA
NSIQHRSLSFRLFLLEEIKKKRSSVHSPTLPIYTLILVPVEKPGVCPRRTHIDWRYCASYSQSRCTCDEECPGKLKCCDFGCGPTCVEPATGELDPAWLKPGVCPRPSGFGICIQECNNDFECQADQKCCSNGCGNVCEILTKSKHLPKTSHVIFFYFLFLCITKCESTCGQACRVRCWSKNLDRLFMEF